MSYTVIEGKAISKADKELVESILGGEMKNSWQKGDGIDQRGEDGVYSRTRKGVSRRERYRERFDQIKWRK